MRSFSEALAEWDTASVVDRRMMLAGVILTEYADTHEYGESSGKRARWRRLRGRAIDLFVAGAGEPVMRKVLPVHLIDMFGKGARLRLLREVVEVDEVLTIVREMPDHEIQSMLTRHDMTSLEQQLWETIRGWSEEPVLV